MTGPLPAGAVARFHGERGGLTEDLLSPARSSEGTGPYPWLAAPLPAGCRVLDLCCGSAPVADLVGDYTGVDVSAAELAEARRRRPGADVRLGDALDRALTPDLEDLDAVVVAMALMLLPFEPLLERCREVLSTGRLLVAMVPLRGDAVRGTAYGAVLAALGELDRPFPEPLLDVPTRAAGFEVLDDSRQLFVRPPDPDLVLSSFYAPDAGADARARARALLTEPLEYPLRRLVLRRR